MSESLYSKKGEENILPQILGVMTRSAVGLNKFGRPLH
jgi:hypothetical protein